MTKRLLIIVAIFFWSDVGYAKQAIKWHVWAQNYNLVKELKIDMTYEKNGYDAAYDWAKSKISKQDAINKALSKCNNHYRNTKYGPNCLVSAIDHWVSMFTVETTEFPWDQEVIKFEKSLIKKTKTKEKKEQVKVTSMIDKAKDTCKSLGFNEGTEKFADCSLKLYSQSVELAAKNNQQVVIQSQGSTSSSGSNVMTIYDPVRDSNALIKRGQGLINGTCTLGDLSNC